MCGGKEAVSPRNQPASTSPALATSNFLSDGFKGLLLLCVYVQGFFGGASQCNQRLRLIFKTTFVENSKKGLIKINCRNNVFMKNCQQLESQIGLKKITKPQPSSSILMSWRKKIGKDEASPEQIFLEAELVCVQWQSW